VSHIGTFAVGYVAYGRQATALSHTTGSPRQGGRLAACRVGDSSCVVLANDDSSRRSDTCVEMLWIAVGVQCRRGLS
jgi:hypothetical protein